MPNQIISSNSKIQLKHIRVDLDEEQCFGVFNAFMRMASEVHLTEALRKAASPDDTLRRVLELAVRKPAESAKDAKKFFSEFFEPFKIQLEEDKTGFVTGYFEPCVLANNVQSPDYSYPMLSRPANEIKRRSSRANIDSCIEEYHPIAWVRDPIEAFMIQVQGSAVLEFVGGRKQRLIFDGRNGHPYSSIGRLLIESGETAPQSMSIETLMDWVRQAGQKIGEKGRNLLWRNESYVFFRLATFREQQTGPIGGAGFPLVPFVSLATDRDVWPYATPFLIRGNLGSVRPDWENFQLLMLSQDTGTAIRGPARGDIFFGTGEQAGKMASLVRHEADFIVLLPR